MGHFAALEELSTHDPIFYTQKWMVRELGLLQSQKDQKKGFFSAKGSSTTITTYKTNYTYMHGKKKQRKSSVRRGARKKNWPKKNNRDYCCWESNLHHLQIRSIYKRSAKTFVRSYRYGYGNFHIRIRLYVSRYAVFLYVRFWPTLFIRFWLQAFSKLPVISNYRHCKV